MQRIILETPSSGFSIKQKLLNIDCACDLLIKEYTGPRLSKDSEIKNLEVVRSKEKEALVSVVLDSLSNLVNAEKYLKTAINTGWGFYIGRLMLLARFRLFQNNHCFICRC